MIKILSQDGKELYDFGRNNIFVCGQKILISDEINIYQGKAALLGIYNDEEEAMEAFSEMIRRAFFLNSYGELNCVKMPNAREKEKGEENNGGEQGETRENSKV